MRPVLVALGIWGNLVWATSECDRRVFGGDVPVQEQIYTEMLDALPEQFDSFPYRDGGYDYWWSQTENEQHPRLMRSRDRKMEEVLPSMSVGKYQISPNHQLIAFTAEAPAVAGTYTLRIHDLDANRDFGHSIEHTAASFAWADDSLTIYFVGLHEGRANRLFRWTIGAHPELVYEEKDPGSSLRVEREGSGKLLLLTSESATSSEVFVISAGDRLKSYSPRREGMIYGLSEAGDRFIVHTPTEIFEAPLEPSSPNEWVSIYKETEGAAIDKVFAYRTHLVIREIQDGLPHIRIYHREMKEHWRLPMREAIYDLDIEVLPDYESQSVRFTYSSPLTPTSEYEYHLSTGKLRILSRDGTGKLESQTYEMKSETLDGQPVAILRNPNVFTNGAAVILLSERLSFKREIFALLDHGFKVVIAHENADGIASQLLNKTPKIYVRTDAREPTGRIGRLRALAIEFAVIIQSL